MTGVTHWMAWEGGVDVAGFTSQNFAMPNVIVHVARMVHTPVGSAPAGMIFWQPDANTNPQVVGFVSHDLGVARYFGPTIFKGTPFEQAPALQAKIEISNSAGSASARVTVNGTVFETEISSLKPLELIHRAPAAMSPFWQQGCEAGAGKATLKVNGKDVSITVPPVGIGGGPGAVWSPSGVYAR